MAPATAAALGETDEVAKSASNKHPHFASGNEDDEEVVGSGKKKEGFK